MHGHRSTEGRTWAVEAPASLSSPVSRGKINMNTTTVGLGKRAYFDNDIIELTDSDRESLSTKMLPPRKKRKTKQLLINTGEVIDISD